MKAFRLIALFTVLTLSAKAQEIKYPALDSSPADIVYYPLNVAKAKDDSTPLIKVVYSRPAKKGREIFGVLEQYGKIWRLGANECTEIKFYKSAAIGGKKIKAGAYSLFAIPNKDKWVLIFNKQLDKWGAFTYNQQKDVMRVEVPVKTLTKPQEILTITFTPAENGARMIIAWDSSQVELPVGI